MSMIKTKDEIQKIRNVCKITATILNNLILHTHVGDTGIDVNNRAKNLFEQTGVEPVFLHLYGFPATLCISVNDTVLHGIPNNKPFKEGDVIKFDIGGKLDGYCSDTAKTFILGKAKNKNHEKLVQNINKALMNAIKTIKEGATLSDIAKEIEAIATKNHYGNITQFHGHGIGQNVHEPPEVYNSVSSVTNNMILKEGLVIAIEPMFTTGKNNISYDGKHLWDIKTLDGSISAHVEHTVLVTKKGYEVLTD